jgi:MOSC domain-containing protein YiiM
MINLEQLSLEELEAGLENIRLSPKENGILEMIVRRPDVEKREMLMEGRLDLIHGLEGDNWKVRGSSATPDGAAHPDAQLTIVNARAITLIAQEKARWQLAGDQLFIDMDLGAENLPAGTRLALGSAVIEITAKPHTGCKKFAGRFGTDATKFVNSTAGKELHLRGVNAKIVQAGTIRVGDCARKL